ncbi:HIT domain-containing protein [Candidatus Tisiphia endosymbiont of Metellina segmentata]|jgi:histidine triad (HIT) family protein|uniref:HIT domain-containing protein n=1 Tax=Candidatus Tisiphia endosymbiont of Metellina segmentata TaxID=3066274 RepID=UPI00281E8191|nr:HIT domain-containing protein [Rickettsia sp.]
MYDKNNVFVKIIGKDIPAEIIYEDDNLIAFNDINPVAPVHIIIIPKKEYIDYSDFILKASSDEIKDYFTKLAYITSLVGLDQDGYRLITNKGVKSGQSVFHFHFHIIGGKTISKLI